MTPRAAILTDIVIELERAKKLHPNWPADIIHAVAVVAEESGEAVRAALNMHYQGGSIADLRTELVQTAAMCVRMIENLPEGKPAWCSKAVWYDTGDGDSVPCTLPPGHGGPCIHDGATYYGTEET